MTVGLTFSAVTHAVRVANGRSPAVDLSAVKEITFFKIGVIFASFRLYLGNYGSFPRLIY